MRSLVFVLVLGVAACAGKKPPEIDGGPPACTGALYDPCFSEHGCTSGICRPFGSGSSTFSACSVTCTAPDNTPCKAGSATGTCNAQGFCEPAAPNLCQPTP